MQTILKLPGFKDDVVTHILSGLGAGFFAVCVGSPVDVVRCTSCSVLNYPYSSDLLLQTSC
jgi:solute carrier family 25 uncoupling protein 8/9